MTQIKDVNSSRTKHHVPARHGRAHILKPGQRLRVINTYGTQVVDFWSFILPTTASRIPSYSPFHEGFEFMRMSSTHLGQFRLIPKEGDILQTNRHQPILEFTRDTSPGIHDTLVSNCTIDWYYMLHPELKERGEYHRNCHDNLFAALTLLATSLEDAGADSTDIAGVWDIFKRLDGVSPDPFNLWMNVPWGCMHDGGPLGIKKTVSKPGDYVEFKNVAGEGKSVVVAMSACPEESTECNSFHPRSVEYEILD